MKHTKSMAIVTLLLLGAGAAAAQSLGDYARAVRKHKPEPSAASRHYDNDNLPTGEPLSVVGPPASNDANAVSANATPTAKPAAADAAARQKAADEWKDKLDKQKQQIDALNHELDLEQRELRLRTAALTTDPGLNVRNVQWDKEQAQYQSDIEAKQKALDAARQQLDEMQERAHKAGIAQTEKDNDEEQNQGNTQDKNKQ